MIAAVTRVIGKPLKQEGMSALSVFRRTNASNRMANRNPTPVATETAKVSTKAYELYTTALFAVPRMAQLVVMRGSYTPGALYRVAE